MGKMRKVIGVVFLMAAVLLAVYWCQTYLPTILEYKKGKEQYKEIEEAAVSTSSETEDDEFTTWKDNLPVKEEKKKGIAPCIDVDGEALLQRNSDYIGWIYIPNTAVSYPVVLSHDNIDYLHTSIDGDYLYAGTIFMDCRCYDGIKNKHSVLYGHNMIDGSMFAGIKKYSDQDYLDENSFFWFITPKYKLLYQIFSVTQSGPYDETVYRFTYTDLDGFQENMKNLADMSMVSTWIIPTNKDLVMTLSTCTDDSSGRFAIHGVLLGALEGK